MFPGFRVSAASFVLASTMFLACSTDPTTAPVHPAPVVPVADSPAHAVDLFRWATENRSFDSYRTLFTDDFVFAFASIDTNGNSWRDDNWSREIELLSFQHLVTGGGEQAPATFLSLALSNQAVKSDPRPGKGDSRHRLATSNCMLNVQFSDGMMANISGRIDLYLARGDVAALPADLGRAPDSTRWYVERWEDVTYSPMTSASRSLRGGVAAPSAAHAARHWTWGSLKALYLPAAPLAGGWVARP